MSRTLASALRSSPLVFAPVPPPARANRERQAASLEATLGLLERHPRLDAVNVPELIDENHDGRPYYRSSDPRVYAAEIAARSGREVVVNKVVAHLPSAEAVRAWASETVRLGLRHAVLVGGSSRYIPYPGPPVAEANGLVRPILAEADGVVGNIAIPQRTGEAHRMLSKTRAGASFFTTQLLFDAGTVTELARRYDRLCREAGVAPAAILVSVGPVADEADAEFVRWLGAELPEDVERGILDPAGGEAAPRSIDNAVGLFVALRDRVRDEGLAVAIGVNVEQLSSRHLSYAERLVSAIESVLDAPAPAGPPARSEATLRLPGRGLPPEDGPEANARPSTSHGRPSSSTIAP
jgi:5,10-methylenetetrahydrofolate reductase